MKLTFNAENTKKSDEALQASTEADYVRPNKVTKANTYREAEAEKGEKLNLQETVNAVIRKAIVDRLQLIFGDTDNHAPLSSVAASLGIHRITLRKLMIKYDIPTPKRVK